MTHRVFALIAVFLLGAFAVPPLYAQSSGTLKLGQKIEGDLDGAASDIFLRANARYPGHYSARFSIFLKKGSSVEFEATGLGQGRIVALIFFDHATKVGPQGGGGNELEYTNQNAKTARIIYKELPATGVYTIVVASAQVGGFTLKAIDPNADGDITKLEARIERLEKELAEARATLKALKEKSRSK